MEFLSNEYLTKIEEKMSDYEDQVLGLKFPKESRGPSCIFMSIEEMKKKTPEELSEAQYQVGQYLIFLQHKININKGWERWAKAKLDEVVARTLPDVENRYGFNERIIIASHKDPVAKKLNNFLNDVKMRTDRMYDLPNKIQNVLECIKDIKYNAIRREKNA